MGAGMGLGTAVFAGLSSSAKAESLKGFHHKPKAKRVIFLFMGGAPSQLDLYDPKPGLQKLNGEPLPESITRGQRVTAMTKGQAKNIAASVFKFAPQGKSGLMMSELLPHLSTVADDICMIKSTHTESINHDPGKTFFCTGTEMAGNPSMGAWLSYGLGSINQDLPNFIVLNSAFWSGNVNVQALYSRLWGTGFLPTEHQGVAFQTTGDPVLFLSNPKGVDRNARRKMLDLVEKMNQNEFTHSGYPEVQASIAQQEMAFKMQMSVPELTDISSEKQATLELYGPEVHKQGSFARNCLLARRMAERDVRFIQLFHRGWDHHSKLVTNLPGQCRDVDQPIAGLIKDLKRRGLLEDTLIVCAGEFGRTTYSQGSDTKNYGRDHHPKCFTTWMAGGGIQGGISYGETDDFCYNIVRDPVHVRDFQATILHQLGVDHHKLTFPFQGLDQKVTGIGEAHVVKGILT
jgi:hypothetical protein